MLLRRFMIAKILKSEFGIECQVRETLISGLPLYMVAGRKIAEVTLLNYCFILVSIPKEDKFGAIALKKQLALYSEKSNGLDVAYCFEKTTKVQRNALIEKRIPFISIPDQIYLPFLGISIRNSYKKEYNFSQEKMMPATQSLFLHFLYNKKDSYILKKQAAEELNLTRTSITRASEQLKQMKLIIEEAYGKEVHMQAVCYGREFYEKAKKYLINPVQKRIYIDKEYVDDEFIVAGESALSLYSMLGEPKEKIYAVYKNKSMVKLLPQIDLQWENEKKACQIELWKYDPGLFVQKGTVDPVSLAMSLQDNEDERVQGELQTYLEECKW